MTAHARQIYVLHKEPGHLRLALPTAFANPGSAQVIERALLRITGVRLAQVDLAHRKLAVHFDPTACSQRQVALVLGGVLDEAAAAASVASPGSTAEATAMPGPLAPRLDDLRERLTALGRAARDQVLALRHSVEAQLTQPAAASASEASNAASASALKRVVNPALFNERAVINFANDIVAFYLIRVHWDLIVRQWIKAPLRHADAWLAMFYLTFLLVRYRKRMSGSPALPSPAKKVAAAPPLAPAAPAVPAAPEAS